MGARRLGDYTMTARVLLLAAMAVLVGTAGVAAAWVLLHLIYLCTNLAYFRIFSAAPLSLAGLHLGPVSILIPVAGSLIVGVMARFGSDKIRGHGIPEALEAILIGRSRIQLRVALLKPLASAIAIGTGGPFGAEGPIIMTGGAFGSLFAQLFHLSAAERKVLLAAGAAAGMTAVFATPIAAVMLALELMLFEWKPRSFIPVGVACVTAMVERGAVLGSAPLFAHAGTSPMGGQFILGWLGLGLACGLGAALASALVYGAEDMFGRLPVHWMWWPALGGVVVGLGGMADPAALGVGYDNITHLLAGDLTLRAMLLLLVVKLVIWAVALGSGTSGGVLAPLLIMGGALGGLAGHFLPDAGVGFWTLLGMAAMMGGTMSAPLTACLFAVEVTGDFAAILPVFVACIASYGVCALLLKRSILTEKIARHGHHVVREYQVDPFSLARVGDVMARPVASLPASMSVAAAMEFLAGPGPHHPAYPVLDAAGRVVGLVSRADILGAAPAETLGALLVGARDVVVAYPDEVLGDVAARLARHGVGRLPVVAREDHRLLGMLARKDMLRVLDHVAGEENTREGLLRWRRKMGSGAPAPAGPGQRPGLNPGALTRPMMSALSCAPPPANPARDAQSGDG